MCAAEFNFPVFSFFSFRVLFSLNQFRMNKFSLSLCHMDSVPSFSSAAHIFVIIILFSILLLARPLALSRLGETNILIIMIKFSIHGTS